MQLTLNLCGTSGFSHHCFFLRNLHRQIPTATVATVAEEGAEDVAVATVMAVVVDEDAMVEEGAVVMEEDADVVDEEQSRKDSMSRTRTHSLPCKDMFSECVAKYVAAKGECF